MIGVNIFTAHTCQVDTKKTDFTVRVFKHITHLNELKTPKIRPFKEVVQLIDESQSVIELYFIVNYLSLFELCYTKNQISSAKKRVLRKAKDITDSI